MWEIAGDDFSLDDNEILEITNLSLDEPELEVIFFNEDEIASLSLDEPELEVIFFNEDEM